MFDTVAARYGKDLTSQEESTARPAIACWVLNATSHSTVSAVGLQSRLFPTLTDWDMTHHSGFGRLSVQSYGFFQYIGPEIFVKFLRKPVIVGALGYESLDVVLHVSPD